MHLRAVGTGDRTGRSVADFYGGELRIAVIDGSGVAPARITSDVTNGDVWIGKDASALIGKVVRLRFDLRGAKLYAIRGIELAPIPPAPRERAKVFPIQPPRSFTFDESDSGWRAIDRLERRRDGLTITAFADP